MSGTTFSRNAVSPKNKAQNTHHYFNDGTERNLYYIEASKFSPVESPYIVEITRKYLKLQASGHEPREVPLTELESEGIQKLSLSFVKLLDESKLSTQEEAEVLDWKNLNPIFTLSNSGISIRFDMDATPTTATPSDDKRRILWEFLTQYARNVFEEKLKDLNVVSTHDDDFNFEVNPSTDDYQEFQNFIKTVWKIMKISVKYAEDNFGGWTTEKSQLTEKEDKLTTVSGEEFSEALEVDFDMSTENMSRMLNEEV